MYCNDDLNKDVLDIKRFIDDGVGIYVGTFDSFLSWKMSTTEILAQSNLVIKEEDWKFAKIGEYVTFLDIKFGFDNNGKLQTDLYRKETDSNAYLEFKSCHPRHVFSSIVYSQGLRLRRIINNNDRLSNRLNEMKTHFTNCSYPVKLVENILNKISTLPRTLSTNNDKQSDNNPLRVISRFGCDKKLCDVVDSVSSQLPFKVEYVKKTGASLNSRLCKSKFISTDPKFGITSDCSRAKCKSCVYMSNKDKIKSTSGKLYKSGLGNCTTKNCIYFAECNLCTKSYVGKTTQMLCGRISEHKSYYNKYRNKNGILSSGANKEKDTLDRYSLGIHLYNEHKIDSPNGFEDSYKFTILERCSPFNLDVKEHLWVQKLRTLFPIGLNFYSPLGFPLLTI